jgi:hypothetical protein
MSYRWKEKHRRKPRRSFRKRETHIEKFPQQIKISGGGAA